MATYRCFECDRFVDGDWHPPAEINGEMLCECCAEEYICEYCGDVMEDKHRQKMGMHFGCYQEARGEWEYQQRKDARTENEAHH